jgi:hypothetical protein
MNLAGYGCIVDDEPKGIWPIPLHEARRTAARYIDEGFPRVRIIEVFSGNSIALKEPTPLFKAEPVSA